eukprot:15365787-Ditylum_brightwellii.AAC.2
MKDKSGQKNKVTGKIIKILFDQNAVIRSIISPYLITWNKFSRHPNNTLQSEFKHDILEISTSLHDIDVSPHTILSKQTDGSNQDQHNLPSPSAYQSNIKNHSHFRMHSSLQHQRRQPKKHRSGKAFDTKFEECNDYKADAEGLLNVGRQLFNHTEVTCPLLHPENIKVQDIREYLVQEHAKNPPCDVDPNKDVKRREPRYPMIPKPAAWNAKVDTRVSFTEDTHQDISDDAGFQYAVEEEKELEEEEDENEKLTSTSDIKHKEDLKENKLSDDDSHFPHPSCKALDMST